MSGCARNHAQAPWRQLRNRQDSDDRTDRRVFDSVERWGEPSTSPGRTRLSTSTLECFSEGHSLDNSTVGLWFRDTHWMSTDKYAIAKTRSVNAPMGLASSTATSLIDDVKALCRVGRLVAGSIEVRARRRVLIYAVSMAATREGWRSDPLPPPQFRPSMGLPEQYLLGITSSVSPPSCDDCPAIFVPGPLPG